MKTPPNFGGVLSSNAFVALAFGPPDSIEALAFLFRKPAIFVHDLAERHFRFLTFDFELFFRFFDIRGRFISVIFRCAFVDGIEFSNSREPTGRVLRRIGKYVAFFSPQVIADFGLKVLTVSSLVFFGVRGFSGYGLFGFLFRGVDDHVGDSASEISGEFACRGGCRCDGQRCCYGNDSGCFEKVPHSFNECYAVFIVTILILSKAFLHTETTILRPILRDFRDIRILR